MLRPLLDLILPRECAACQIPGPSLCGTCEGDLWAVPPQWVYPQVIARPDHGGIGRAVVRAHKEGAQHELAGILGTLVADAVVSLLYETGSWPPPTPLVLVPVPTRNHAYRRRGFNPAAAVATVTAKHLGPQCSATCRHLLELARQPGDQRTLGASDRVRNMAGTMRYRGSAPSSLVVVVDDVVTTGATLDEALRALQADGVQALGAVAAVATPLARPSAR